MLLEYSVKIPNEQKEIGIQNLDKYVRLRVKQCLKR